MIVVLRVQVSYDPDRVGDAFGPRNWSTQGLVDPSSFWGCFHCSSVAVTVLAQAFCSSIIWWWGWTFPGHFKMLFIQAGLTNPTQLLLGHALLQNRISGTHPICHELKGFLLNAWYHSHTLLELQKYMNMSVGALRTSNIQHISVFQWPNQWTRFINRIIFINLSHVHSFTRQASGTFGDCLFG